MTNFNVTGHNGDVECFSDFDNNILCAETMKQTETMTKTTWLNYAAFDIFYKMGGGGEGRGAYFKFRPIGGAVIRRGRLFEGGALIRRFTVFKLDARYIFPGGVWN